MGTRIAVGPALFLCLLFSACGGGGGGSNSTTPADETKTATASITPAGGAVSIGTQVLATVAPNTLLATGDVTVTVSPKADAEALSSNDITLSLPADKLTVSPAGELTLYFYPDAATAGAASVRGAMSLANSLDPRTLFAKVRIGSVNAVAFVVPVVWDAAKEAYAVSLKTTQLASAALQGTFQTVVQPLVDIGISIWLIQNLDDSNTPRVIYRWCPPPQSWPGCVPSAASTPEKTDKVPLILVHGIKVLSDSCGTNSSYRETWQEFANNFFEPPFVELTEKLRDKYELYTFQYPTNQSIAGNGQWLTQKISKHFSNRPVVIVSHSMGGLVTRAADLLYGKQGLNAQNDIDISKVITLDTPHLGVNWSEAARLGSILFQINCSGGDSHQGALDLGWGETKADGSCDNLLLCDSKTGLNTINKNVNNVGHLKKYIPYSGSFDIVGAPSQNELETWSWTQLFSATIPSCLLDHPLYYCAGRMQQVYSQAFLPFAARSDGDGVTLVKSQRLRTFDGSSWIDQPELFSRPLHPVFDADHSSIHDDVNIFRDYIRPDLLDLPTPAAIPAARRVSAGYTFALAARADGTLFGAGYSGSGELGLGDVPNTSNLWVQLVSMSDVIGVSSSKSAGSFYSVAVRRDGTVWVAGTASVPLPIPNGASRVWTQSNELGGQPVSSVTAVAANNFQILGIKADGTLWGAGDAGLTGAPPVFGYVREWTQVPGMGSVVAVSAGTFHSLAVKADGSLWGIGSNFNGELGLGNVQSVDTWTRLVAPGMSDVRLVAGGTHFSLAVTGDGSLWVTGQNDNGQIGLGTATSSASVWTKVSGLASIIAVAASDGGSFALASDGSLWVTGLNFYGELGVGGQLRRTQWERAKAVDGSVLTGVTAIDAAQTHSIALTTRGTVLVAGANDFGQNGLGPNPAQQYETLWKEIPNFAGF